MLTFEKIRELERTERDNKQLQKLPDNITDEIAEYLSRKKRIKDKTSSDMMELENVKKTIERLFDLREHKIVDMLLYSVRTGLPVENLSKYEEHVFDELLHILKKYRNDFFSDIEKEREKKVVYRVKKSIPAFVGPDMKTYKLAENEVVRLPKPLNDLLMKKGVIERVVE